MKENVKLIGLYFISFIFQCNGVSLKQQLEHVAKRRLESQGLLNEILPSRRYEYDPRELSNILGVPNRPSHLPEAEPILPGHTLNRPALGMLKSAVKFPHRELEDGTGVYGGIDNLGLKYDSKQERLLYTQFRRFPSDYIMVIPSSGDKYKKTRFKLETTVLDLDGKKDNKIQLQKIIKKLNNPAIKSNVRVYLGDLNNMFLKNLRASEEVDASNNIPKYDNDEVYNLYNKKAVLRNKETEGQKQMLKNLSKERDLDETDTEQQTASKDIQWFFDSMDKFNHIKINQEAPELNELEPPTDDKENELRQWWYYNADDYKQFS